MLDGVENLHFLHFRAPRRRIARRGQMLYDRHMKTVTRIDTCMHTGMGGKRARSERAACILVLASLTLLAAACFLRAFYGFDWSDEAYYTALPYRYAMGDRLFSDGWELHQLSVMFTIPLIRVFLLVTGGATDGIMLYMRLLFVAFQYGTALFLLSSFRRRYGIAAAALVSALALMFVHFALPNFSYDTLVILFTCWSIGFAARALDGRAPVWNACLAGLAYAFAVQAYPQYVLSFPVFLLFWLLRAGRMRRDGARDRCTAGFLLGIAGAVLLFAAFVLTRSSLGELLENLPYLLSDPSHERQGMLHLLLEYCKVIWFRFSYPLLWVIAATIAAFFLRLSPEGSGKERLRPLLLAALALGGIALTVGMLCHDLYGYAKINFLTMPLAFAAPALLLLLRREDMPLPALLLGLGTVLSLAIQLIGSNMGLYASSIPLLLCTFGSIFAARDCLRALPARAALPRLLCVCAALLLLAGISVLRVTGLYRTDGTLPEQTDVLSSGPGKGIRVTPESAAKYGTVVREIQENAGDGTVLFVRSLPFGYLVDGVATGTPSVWLVSPNTERTIEYYDLRPENIPDTIFLMDLDVGHGNVTRDLDIFFAGLPDGCAYTPRTLETCVVYRRIEG